MTDAPIDLGLSDDDLWQFNEGTHARLYDHLGAHPVDGGTRFAVWAPAAEGVWVVEGQAGGLGLCASTRDIGK